MTHAEMSNLELAFRLRRLGRRAPQWLAVVADRLEGMQGDPALDAAYAAGQAAASVPRGEPVAWYTPLIGNYAHVVWGKRPDTPMEWAPLYAAPAVAQDKEKP